MALAYPDSNDMSVLNVKGIQQILKSCSDLWFGKGRLTLQLALINSPRSYSILVTHQNDRKFISFNFFVKTVPLVNEVIYGRVHQSVGVRSDSFFGFFQNFWCSESELRTVRCSDCLVFGLIAWNELFGLFDVRVVRAVPAVRTVRSIRHVRAVRQFLKILLFAVRTVPSENLEQWTPAVRCSVDSDLRTYYEFRDCFIHTESLILRKSI